MESCDESFQIYFHQIWPYIPYYPYRIFIIGGLGSDKAKVLLNLIKHEQPDIGKIYLYVKDPCQSKYQLLISGREKMGTEKLKNPKAFIDHWQTIDNVYENLDDYNPANKRKVFDDMVSDMEANKKLSPIVTELFLRGRKLNISFVSIS